MFRVGEETGTLDAQLATAAAFYDREFEMKLKRFTSLFEPAVIIFMGVIVGFVAIALVSAMYGIYKPSQRELNRRFSDPSRSSFGNGGRRPSALISEKSG